MSSITPILRRLRRRLADESGFTMIVAMSVLLVTSLLLTATFVALEGDTHLTKTDLDGKRAYYAAQAGVNAFLYQLNNNSNYWQTCSNDSQGLTNVPGSTTGEQYEYYPVPANGNTSCNQANVINSLIDTNSGTLSLKFYGHAGTNPAQTRGIIATFKRRSPLDYLWYTVYEALDSSISGLSGCNVFYRAGRSTSCNIYWASSDTVRGSMYTQDQFLISSGASPTFGRNSGDTIATLAGGALNNVCSGGNCQSAIFNGVRQTGLDIAEPTDNSGLVTDAQTYGKVYTGTTTIALPSTPTTPTIATVTNCPTQTTCTTSYVDITQYPILYVQNAAGCSSAGQYDPFNTSYPSYGCNGDVYISGTYTSSLTVAAANNIIITGDLKTTHDSSGAPTGNGMLGLVANQFVRIEHVYSGRPDTRGSCTGGTEGTSLNNPVIDASILSLDHSFIVDNYDCGTTHGSLTLNGSLIQRFRGTVGTLGSNGAPVTGYSKNYSYDDRLKYLAPPYLFDILNSGWRLARESLCVPNGTDPASAC